MEEHIKLGEGGGGGRCYHHRHLHHHNHHSLDWKGERALDWIGLSGWTAAAAVCVGIVALGIDGTEVSYGWDWSIGTNLSGGTDGKGSMEGF